MRLLAVALLCVAQGCTCSGIFGDPERPTESLRELRAGFRTRVFYPDVQREAPDEPPARVFELVRYRAPLGENAAYVSPSREGERRPAIIWIGGGIQWGIARNAWAPHDRANDQSASAFREAGIVLMLPSLRGANENPGRIECFFGEVEDVLAAADYLATRPGVDPHRIYLGGHSTGGTLALLVAASTDRFRAVFAFGPVEDPRAYPSSVRCLPAEVSAEEAAVRTPIHFVDEITTPTFMIEGAVEGNGGAIDALYGARGSAPLARVLVPGMNHFSVLAPGTEEVANAIVGDTSSTPQIRIDAAAIRARSTRAAHDVVR